MRKAFANIATAPRRAILPALAILAMAGCNTETSSALQDVPASPTTAAPNSVVPHTMEPPTKAPSPSNPGIDRASQILIEACNLFETTEWQSGGSFQEQHDSVVSEHIGQLQHEYNYLVLGDDKGVGEADINAFYYAMMDECPDDYPPARNAFPQSKG